MNRLKRIKAEQIENGTVDYTALPKQSAAINLKDLAHYQEALKVDLGKVAGQRDLADKTRIKQSVLPTYLAFVQDFVESGDNYPNTVAVQIMVWLLDVGEIEHGLSLALHLIEQGQRMPDKIKRDIPTFLVDELYEWASALLKEDQGANPYFETLVQAMEQGDWDVHPLIWSKAYSMLSKHQVRNKDYPEAHESVLKAEQRNPEKAGVKGLKAEIEKHLSKPTD